MRTKFEVGKDYYKIPEDFIDVFKIKKVRLERILSKFEDVPIGATVYDYQTFELEDTTTPNLYENEEDAEIVSILYFLKSVNEPEFIIENVSENLVERVKKLNEQMKEKYPDRYFYWLSKM